MTETLQHDRDELRRQCEYLIEDAGKRGTGLAWIRLPAEDILPLLNDAEQLEKIEQRTEPEGWKLVPISPTDQMLDAGAQAAMGALGGRWDIYAEMLAAAPQPQED